MTASLSEPDPITTETPAPLENDAPAEAEGPVSKSPIRTTIKVTPEDEPYLPGQCTVSIVLTLLPNDGQPDGRQVLMGIRSHDEEPLIGLARLNNLSLPGEIAQLLERYELSLPALGQARAEREAQEKAKQEQAEVKRKQAQARKAAKADTGKAKKSLLAPPPEAPPLSVSTTSPTPTTEATPSPSDATPAPAAQITLFG